jgi:hypothetical protein
MGLKGTDEFRQDAVRFTRIARHSRLCSSKSIKLPERSAIIITMMDEVI